MGRFRLRFKLRGRFRLRQKDPELLGILGNYCEGPGIVGKGFNCGRQATLVLARGSAPASPRLPRVTNHLKVSRGLLDGRHVAVSGLRQKDPFTLY